MPVRILSLLVVAFVSSLSLAAERNWELRSPRLELQPSFALEENPAPQSPTLRITTGDSVAEHGWWQRPFAVSGGKFYEFRVERQTKDVATPRRSAIVRIVWQDEKGKTVKADPPAGRENESGPIPLAEPEHPLDGETRDDWTMIRGVYRAPSKATQALVELHLQWSPKSSVTYRNVKLDETNPPPARKVRLAAVHYRPSGKSPYENNAEYAPLIRKAAEEQADLVVLGETIPYVGVKKKPHEVAEKVPGQTTEYFGELAKRHKLHIVTCLYEADGDTVYNTAALLGPDGKLIGKYRKVCLPHSEVEAGVTPGSEYPVFETRLGKIGLMICYDGFFPEVARELTNRGAEIIA